MKKRERRPYQRPKIEEVRLNSEESVLAGCKQSEIPSSNNDGTCMGFQCKEVTS